jgi:glycosyltransferase involved in cell wall biosynthesis
LRKSNWGFKSKLIRNVNKVYSLSKLKASRFDVFHPTYYDPYFIEQLDGKPFVVTFFDMIYEKFGHIYPELTNDKVILNGKKTVLSAANKVIAISNSTKNDLIELFGVDPDKITVIYLGSSMPISVPNTNRIIKEPYVLFVGNRGRYKNFSFFLESVADLLSEIKLICAGGGKFNKEESKQIEKLSLRGQVLQVPFTNDETLANFYANALCFVFPSLYEGFGIPVLEAFSCGCTCVLSDRASLPEVGGEAAVYFNPEDCMSIHKAVSSVISNEDLRNDKIEKGYERLSHFSWDKTRVETFNLYASLL